MNQEQPIASDPESSLESKIRPTGFVSRILEWNASHPVLAIVFVSLLAVVINCYPILFCGKSYVSPTCVNGAFVYNWWPPLPGMERWPAPTSNLLHSVHGSDTAAVMWWGVPVGFVESRSLLEHGELPLWNRYGHGGDTLIGQAISMLGDPLHLIVIIGHGSAWAWDTKFLAAKFFFCLGFGLLIRRLLRNQPLSLIFTALAAYCGAYFFIYNHPVFFVLTYAPWILLAAIEYLDLRSAHYLRWGLLWLLANLSCLTAGHVEVAVILIGGLNFAAVAGALIEYRNFASSARVLGRMGVVTLLFLGLAAPAWMSFLVTLDGSYTAHTNVEVQQLPATMLPGAFDDLFYLLLRSNDTLAALAPGTSLLVLTGCCFSVLGCRQLKTESFFWVNSAAIILWGSCVFGATPSSFLAAIPLLNRVGHTATDFSYLLVIHLTIQSAYGFRCLAKVDKLRQVAADVACIGGIFTGLFILYACGYWHQPIPWLYFLCAGMGAVGAPLLFVFMKSRRHPTLTIGWAGIIILGFIPNFRFGFYNFGNDAFVMRPGPRVVLNSPSAAIEKIKADTSEPFRVVGLQWNIMGDYSAVYELEDIRSCAPLSNGEFINLIRNFPGVELSKIWKIKVVYPVQAQPLLNLLNVKYLLAPPEVEPGVKLDFRITDRSDFGVVENLQVWPRAFFSSQVVSIGANEDFIQHLLENDRRPFIALTKQEMKKLPGLEQLEAASPSAITPAANYRLLPNSTEFDVHAPSTGVVCLTEGQAKDFTATANNESKAVLTVNRAFKGIYLDKPGDYHIKFTYRPRHWRLACALFWISTGIILLLVTAEVIHARIRRKIAAS